MFARSFRPTLESLEARETPATLSAFAGLGIAASHLEMVSFPPNPIQPALIHSPVFALNFQFPPNPIAPQAALISALSHYSPSPVHSPVFVGVEIFLNSGGGTATT
jgi:hypothetical protein